MSINFGAPAIGFNILQQLSQDLNLDKDAPAEETPPEDAPAPPGSPQAMVDETIAKETEAAKEDMKSGLKSPTGISF